MPMKKRASLKVINPIAIKVSNLLFSRSNFSVDSQDSSKKVLTMTKKSASRNRYAKKENVTTSKEIRDAFIKSRQKTYSNCKKMNNKSAIDHMRNIDEKIKEEIRASTKKIEDISFHNAEDFFTQIQTKDLRDVNYKIDYTSSNC